jgi:molybdopterin-containing oxidoreductase family iron-sulfur binding subunit
MKEPPNTPSYWRSIQELADDPAVRELREQEFAGPLELEPPESAGRRRFLQIMGASMGLAAAAGCRWKEDHLLPHSERPTGHVPGETERYATSYELGGVGAGLLVTAFDGRPIKVEGNPEHPTSGGSATAFHQASVLSLYDPDRAKSVTAREGTKRVPKSFADFERYLAQHLPTLAAHRGRGLRVLADVSSSPSRAGLVEELTKTFPEARFIEYSPAVADGVAQGSILAFGASYRTLVALENARVVVTLDADLIAPTNPVSQPNARGLIQGRRADTGAMSRLYAIESTLTLTGSLADHRIPMRSSLIKAVVAWLDAALSARVQAPPGLRQAPKAPDVPALNQPEVRRVLDAMVSDLLANPGASVIVAGDQQPAEVHALVHWLNALLDNVGRTVWYRPSQRDGRMLSALQGLTREMAEGTVDTLFVLDANPVYTAPADVPFEKALANVKNVVVLSDNEHETARHAHWHLPLAHYLESWGDCRAHDGTVSLQQPIISPLFGGRSVLEVLALLAGEKTEPREIVRRTHPALASEGAWRKALHDGVVANTATAPSVPELRPLAPLTFDQAELAKTEGENGRLELAFLLDYKVYDGRLANNAWLQELPDTLTKQTWGNAARISPATAKKLSIGDADLVKLTLDGRELTLPAVYTPGQAPDTITITLGYGRSRAGIVGGASERKIEVVGANAYALRTSSDYQFGRGLEVQVVGGQQKLATTQHLHAIDPIGKRGIEQRQGQIIREATLVRFKKEPDFAQHVVHHPPLENLWKEPVSYDGHRWGMSIDLNKCIGCNACVVACQAENNIPVVGKEQVHKGREMLWLRVDRYYSGTPESPSVAFQPMPCQHCENAPCEQVCPVGATLHSSEGLNDMVYNRCIGTRYCSNNCPYKVRRFNYFNYHLDKTGITPYHDVSEPDKKLRQMVLNPDVTVRSRGVMEKCTFCVQRIQKVKIKAKNAKRAIEDGEIKTACQQTCPTQAIVFGDLNDRSSQVAELHARSRAYELLGELNNRPRVRYLAKIKNPHPEVEG